MLFVDKDGWVNNPIITTEPRPMIEHEPIGSIRAVVLHRTATANANSVLNAWNTQNEGAHFLISELGNIYQTASLKRQCWHVGKIYARCRTTGTCTEQDAKYLEGILRKKNTNWGSKFILITKHELSKNYPQRFPHNHDSLGIEVVGEIKSNCEIYEMPSQLQLKSVIWLLDELVATYGFSLKDIYAHGKIAHKNKSEGVLLLKAYTIHKQREAK
jgi:N-acetyl-anhydromuramyl-L-alanine amidase AmpD